MIAWSVVGMVILLIGANYLRGQLQEPATESIPAVTVGLKEEKQPRIKVHVAGAVARPGLYEFEEGDRAADALERAGGPLPEADLSLINLAAKLVDGQQVAVREKGAGNIAFADGAVDSAPGGLAQPLNLNTASAAELETLDGVGPKTAQKIIDFREAQGGFKSVDELLDVPGIGPAKFEQIRDKVIV